MSNADSTFGRTTTMPGRKGRAQTQKLVTEPIKHRENLDPNDEDDFLMMQARAIRADVQADKDKSVGRKGSF